MPLPPQAVTSSRHKQSSSQKARKESSGGPPREVIVKITTHTDQHVDNLLDTLLDDEPSVVSSLGGVEEFGGKNNPYNHNLDKLMSEGSKPKDRVEAARSRFKSASLTSTKRFSSKGLIHLDDEDGIAKGNLDEVSLGEKDERRQESLSPNGRDTVNFKSSRYPIKQSKTDDTSRTASGSDDTPDSRLVTKERSMNRRISNKDEEEDRESTDEDEDDTMGEKTAGTKDLLARVQDRMALQKSKDEILRLQEVIQTKNTELEVLAGQLRRAVETKCDLVLAHTELERHHEQLIQGKESERQELSKANFGLMEGLAEVERDMMNEIVNLKKELDETRRQHVQELQDWERMHMNEMLEKDCEIARLKEQVRKLVAKNSYVKVISAPDIPTGELIAC